MTKRTGLYIAVVAALSLVAIACGSDGGAASDAVPTTSPSATAQPGISTTPGPNATPDPASVPAPKFGGYTLDLSEGDFWEYRWSFEDVSCYRFQCSGDEDDGVFVVTLGSGREVEGVTLYELAVSGKSAVSGENRDFAPRWKYLGVDGNRIVVSNGVSLVTLFDAGTGKWAGSGYFTNRFDDDELISAASGFMSTSFEIAGWPGVRQGEWQHVGRSASQSECEIIAGERICPNEDTFSYTENEYYRAGVGPVAYQFRNSQSFSGMENTFSTTEWVALTASSLRGDAPDPTPTPIPPTPTPEPPPEHPDLGALLPLFGPSEGGLRLDPRTTQIPDFSTGLSLDRAIVTVDFATPGVTGGRWSQGLTFRQSEEEVFHAVYLQGDGTWGHFVRTGSLSSERDLGSGSVSLQGSTNRLTVVFGGAEGQMFLNGEFVAELDLSTPGAQEAGDVRVMSGLLGTDVMDGSLSQYSGFAVYPSP